ncbi:ribosomal protein L11 methyltransferase [Dethiosulfatibacter aminovorans DSM 17477]|uniref:Ribosomal protein L11 methyltransferase n=1 Tax=Dethiosulfatibacter aminovorans DSM 17477 TaxID=1121476 RepID=A0A1M6DUA8_9FIRM|nr:50S ribosomal protein L11 methyltransferase [Dethiosulfatibacter aminovorans]SHI76753.1 ribosomal protein L11 methyltransferase [Dethiosulfatibacter aminovorans DSM 17477]
MKWIEIVIKTTFEAKEAVTNILHEAMVEGIVIEDPNDILNLLKEDERWDYLDEDLAKDYYDGVVIKGYFENDENWEEKKDFIKERINMLPRYDLDLGLTEIEIQDLEDRDWNSEWKKNFKPFKLGENVVVKPTWEEYSQKEGEIIIEIDPGAAFGTGTHETTSLCIEQLEGKIDSESKVLDIGTGTGILAILSSKLGAKEVLGIDIDDDSVRIAKENVEVNDCDNVDIKKGNLLNKVDYEADIVVANITADIIIRMVSQLSNVLKNGGLFISSGILATKVENVRTALVENDFDIVETLVKGEWAGITARLK